MSDRLFVSTRKGLFVFDRSGSGSWGLSRSHFVGDNVTLVLPDRRDGSVYAALDHGHFGVKVHCSDDGGDSFEEVATPEYPEKPEGWDEALPEDTPPPYRQTPWKLIRIWSLEAGLADQPGVIWCGTIPGGVFRSDDRGASWTMMRSLWDHEDRKQWFGGGADQPGAHSILVDPRDGQRVAVGISCGGVWITENGGETWNVGGPGMKAEFMPPDRQDDPRVQDPHLVQWCPADPDKVWTQHHCGIWKSTDGIASWQRIDEAGPSTFGFAVAVHPTDPDTAWFVPAISDQHRIPVDGRLVVTRTRDGGATFDVLTKGLPEQPAYDLVLRHALSIDDSGDRLAFGSTTGGLCISEDQGDSWVELTSHLPPVYAVRFA